jgi:NADH-ubiquinone oxidoreductase chain 4
MLVLLLVFPIFVIFVIASIPVKNENETNLNQIEKNNIKFIKVLALSTSILTFIISLSIYLLFYFSTNQFQFVAEHYELNYFDIYLGIDGISIYFMLLTTIIIPVSLVSN